MTSQKRPSSIDDALKMLDEALLKQQLPNLSPRLNEELNSAVAGTMDAVTGTVNSVTETVGVLKTKLTDTLTEAMGEVGLSEMKDLQEGLQQAKDLGLEFSKELGQELNKKIQENPWPIIGGIAIGAAAFGFLLGQRSSKS